MSDCLSRLDSKPDVLLIHDLADVLHISRRQIDRRRRFKTFPIPELEGLDRRARWSKANVRAYLERDRQAGHSQTGTRHLRAVGQRATR